MLNLDTLYFSVNTEELDKALTKVNTLATAMGEVTKASQRAKKAADDEAAARQGAAQATQAQADAANTNTNSTRQSISALEKQQKILQYMTEGFSRGQSSILATANAAGVATTELQELGKVLQTQRKLIGGDTFDKSLSGLIAMKNQLGELREANRLYSAGIEMSSSQTRELARDKERIIEKMKLEGATLTEIKEALKQHNAEYIKAATAVNALAQAEKNSQAEIKKSNDALTKKDQALMKVTKELERSQRAVDGLNEGLQVSNSNRLLNFERLLKASGATADVASTKLAAYKKNLDAVQKQQQQDQRASTQRQEDFLARSLTPQLSDVAVSLYGGMPLSTVLMQQGLQVRDLVEQSGVAADRLGAVLQKTGQAFFDTIGGAANAVGGLVFGALETAASNLLDFAGGLAMLPDLQEGWNKALAWTNTQLLAMGVNTAAIQARFQAFAASLTKLTAIALGAFIVALTSVAVAMYQVSSATSEMNSNLVLFGARTGLTKQAMLDLAEDTKTVGSTFVDVIEVFGQLAKIGTIPTDMFDEVTAAALNFSNVTGQSIEDTLDNYKKLANDPIKVLSDMAKETGAVTQEDILRVKALVDVGEKTNAATLATKIYTAALTENTEYAKMNLSPLSQIWLFMADKIRGAWGEVQKFSESLNPVVKLLGAVGMFGNLANFAIMSAARSLGAFAALIGAVLSDLQNLDLNMTQSKSVISGIKEEASARFTSYKDNEDQLLKLMGLRESTHKKTLEQLATERAVNANAEDGRVEAAKKAARTIDQIRSDAMATGDRETLRALNNVEDIAAKEKIRSDILKEQKDNIANISGVNKDYESSLKRINNALATGAINADQAKKSIDALNASQQKNKPKQTKELDTFFDSSMGAFRKQTIDSKASLEDLTDAHKKYLEVIGSDKYAKLSDTRKREIGEAYQAAQAIELVADKEELRLKAMKELEDAQLKSLGFTSNYAEQVKLLNYALENNAISTEDYGRVLEFIQKNQPYYKDAADAVKKLNEEGKKLLDNLDEQLASELGVADSIQLQLSLMGKTEAESKKALGLLKIKLDYEKEIADIQSKAAGITPEAKLAAEARALDIRRQKELNLNSEISADAAKKQFEEFEKIQKDISDVIFTAITEGGKAAGAKLKDILKAALRERLKVYIDAVVNNVTGGLFGTGGGANSSGGASNSIIGKAVSSIAPAIISGIGNTIGAGTIGAMTGAALGTTSLATTGAVLGANAAGTGISGLLAATNAFGTAVPALTTAATAVGTVGSTVTGAASTLTGALAAIPGWGWAAMAALAVFGLGSKKTPGNQHEGGIYSSAGTDLRTVATNITGDSGNHDMLTRQNQGLMTFVKTTVDTVLETTTAKAKAIGVNVALGMDAGFTANLNGQGAQKNTFAQAQVFADGNLVDSYINNRLDVDTEKAGPEFIAQLNEMAAKAVLAGTEFARTGETSVQTLDRLSNSFIAVNSVLDTLGVTVLSASLSSADLSSKLIEAFGGMETFTASASSYYENFYTEEEKLETGVRQLGEAFNKLGLVMPDVAAEDAIKEFRKLAEKQVVTTEEGRKTYAALVQLSPEFKRLVDDTISFNEVSKEASKSIKEIADSITSLKEESEKLNIDLAEAQGDTSKAKKLRYDLQTKGMTKDELVAFDINEGIRNQIKVAESAAKSSAEAKNLAIDLALAQGDLALATKLRYDLETKGMTEAEVAAYSFNEALRSQISFFNTLSNLASEAFTLENELLTLQGATDAVKARIRQKDLADLTKGLDAESAIKIKFAYDSNEITRKQIAVLNERLSVEEKLVTALGDSARVRRLELSATDDSNRSLLKKVFAIDDSKANLASALSKLEQSVEKEKQSLQAKNDKEIENLRLKLDNTVVDSISKIIDSFEAIRKMTADAAFELRKESDLAADLAESREYLLTTLGLFKSGQGSQVDQDRLGSAIGSVTSQGTETFKTAVDFKREKLTQANILSEISKEAKQSKSFQETQLDLAKEANNLIDEQIKAIEDDTKRQLAMLDNQLTEARKSVNALYKIDDSVLSVASAIANLTSAMGSYSQAIIEGNAAAVSIAVQMALSSIKSGSVAAPAAVANLQDKLGVQYDANQWLNAGSESAWLSSAGALGLTTDTSSGSGTIYGKKLGQEISFDAAREFINSKLGAGNPRAVYDAARDFGIDSTSLDALAGFTPGTSLQWAMDNNVPLFNQGTNYTNEGLAYLHEGEAVVPRPFNPAAGGMMSDNSEVVFQLEMMRHELRANVVHTSKLAKQLERLTVPTNEGDALQTKTVA